MSDKIIELINSAIIKPAATNMADAGWNDGLRKAISIIQSINTTNICAGCMVRGDWEHRCHGEGCECEELICKNKQGRISHEDMMEIVNEANKKPKPVLASRLTELLILKQQGKISYDEMIDIIKNEQTDSSVPVPESEHVFENLALLMESISIIETLIEEGSVSEESIRVSDFLNDCSKNKLR